MTDENKIEMNVPELPNDPHDVCVLLAKSYIPNLINEFVSCEDSAEMTCVESRETIKSQLKYYSACVSGYSYDETTDTISGGIGNALGLVDPYIQMRSEIMQRSDASIKFELRDGLLYANDILVF